jgi:hypothetical protein
MLAVYAFEGASDQIYAVQRIEAADEIGNAARKRLGDLYQPRKADAVIANFVFLYRQVSQFGLA